MTSEMAPLISAVGCKKTLITATPLYDCDSMCSTLLTKVVSDLSKIDTMRVSISEGTSPLYFQMTLTTGMLMLGKISTGVRSRTTGQMSSRTSENTMNVYGRASASLTIHILILLLVYFRVLHGRNAHFPIREPRFKNQFKPKSCCG